MRSRLLLGLVLLAAFGAGSGGLAPRGEAAVYWTGSAGHLWAANTDGSMAIGAYPYGISNLMPRQSSCGLAVDADHIYWGDNSNAVVGRMELSNTRTGKADIIKERLGINQALVTGVSTCGVAVSGEQLYWSNGGGKIGRANVDGSAVNRDFISGLGSACGIAVDAGHVYWGDPLNQAVGRARRDGGEVEPEFIPAAGEPCGLAVDAGHLYWSHESAIGRANLDGSEPDPDWIQLNEGVCGVAVNASHVFWSYYHAFSGAVVGRANLDGSGAGVLVNQTGYGSGCGIALDSRVFQPALPDASVPLQIRSVKHERGGKQLTLVVVAPTRGTLTVRSPKIGWSLDKGPDPGPEVAGRFLWKLKLWPGKGKIGKRILKQLRKKGKAPITLRLTWQQDGHLGSEQLERLAFKR